MARILLIDDDDLLRAMLCSALTHYGHTVIEAREGNEGLRLFPHSNADIVITDLVMPGKEGLEVLMALQKLCSSVKVIVISGGVRGRTSDVLLMAKHLGAARVLAKPFLHEELLAAINDLLPSIRLSEPPPASP